MFFDYRQNIAVGMVWAIRQGYPYATPEAIAAGVFGPDTIELFKKVLPNGYKTFWNNNNSEMLPEEFEQFINGISEPAFITGPNLTYPLIGRIGQNFLFLGDGTVMNTLYVAVGSESLVEGWGLEEFTMAQQIADIGIIG